MRATLVCEGGAVALRAHSCAVAVRAYGATSLCVGCAVSVRTYSVVLGCANGVFTGSTTSWWLRGGRGFRAVQNTLGASWRSPEVDAHP